MSDTTTKTSPSTGAYDDLTLDEAREREEQAHEHLADLRRLVESGENLDAVGLIRDATFDAEAATSLRKGVEVRTRKAQEEEWNAKRDELREKVSAERERDREAREEAEAEAVDALRRYVEVIGSTSQNSASHDYAVRQLEAEAERLELPNTDAHISTGSRYSQVFSAVGVTVDALADVAIKTQTEQELRDVMGTWLANPNASLQAVLRKLPGRIARHVTHNEPSVA